MSRYTARTWNVPQVPMSPPPSAGLKDPEDFGLSDFEALDPGPLGLVAARIQLFDRRERTWSYSDNPQLLDNGTTAKGKASRTLGYQAGAKKTKKNIPEYGTLSGNQTSGSVLLGVETGADTSRGRSTARRSLIFSSAQINKESEKVEELYRKLAIFSLYGLPRLPDNLRDHWELREGEESRIFLQDSWRDIVTGHETMSRKKSHQQEAMWELLHTEVTYLRKLKIITDLFLSGLLNLQTEGILQEVDPRCLFSNIEDIIRAHRGFWQEVMSPVLEQARASGKALDPVLLCDGFRTFPDRFHSYVTYCLAEARCLQYAHVTQQNNKLFAMYVKWAETHKQSNRMRLNDMLVKPHQRLTKYPLLLKAILKKTEDHFAKETIVKTIATVENFIRWIDSQMQMREEQQKLALIASRIRSYDVVEGSGDEVERNVQEFSILDLTLPMVGIGPQYIRQLIIEGSLKMKEGKESKIEVHCLLFTDLFLITKPLKKANRAKVIRQPLMLEKVVSRELKDPGTFLLMYVNELHCVVAAYTFQTPSSALCKEWTDSLFMAQKQLEMLRSREAWICHQQFKQLQEEGQNGGHSARNSPGPSGIDSREKQASQSEKVGQNPQLVVTPPENLVVSLELSPESEAQEGETGGGSPPSPRPGLPRRPRSPGKFGVQKFIERRLKREDGTARIQPEIWAQAPGQAQEDPEEELEIQAQAPEQAHKGPEDGLEMQAQAREQAQEGTEEIIEILARESDRTQAKPELGPSPQPPSANQAQVEVDIGESTKSPGTCSVLETLQRAKAMEGRPAWQGSEVGNPVDMENIPKTSSEQRVLTLTELQRMRSPLDLNSLLTTSEV